MVQQVTSDRGAGTTWEYNECESLTPFQKRKNQFQMDCEFKCERCHFKTSKKKHRRLSINPEQGRFSVTEH